MNRRGFLGGLAALIAAPAIVRFDSLMPIRGLDPLEEFMVGYKGASYYDAGVFYCPYVPLQIVRAIGPDFKPKLEFKPYELMKTRIHVDKYYP